MHHTQQQQQQGGREDDAELRLLRPRRLSFAPFEKEKGNRFTGDDLNALRCIECCNTTKNKDTPVYIYIKKKMQWSVRKSVCDSGDSLLFYPPPPNKKRHRLVQQQQKQ